jgi:hypothetical protein
LLACCALAAEMNLQQAEGPRHACFGTMAAHQAVTQCPVVLHTVLTVALCVLLLCCCAVGGVCVHAQTGSPQAAQLGLGAGALLGLSAVAMSDIRDSDLGEIGVKAAWGESTA